MIGCVNGCVRRCVSRSMILFIREYVEGMERVYSRVRYERVGYEKGACYERMFGTFRWSWRVFPQSLP